MRIAVVSYSLTGNNSALAKSVANALKARIIVVTGTKTWTSGTIALDLLFNRTPQIKLEELEAYDLILFSAPVWAGQVASPLRAYLKRMKRNSCRYAFFSISGGADGPNPKLAGELKRRTGRQPEAVIDLHIADLLPKIPKPTRVVTSAYRLSAEDITKLTGTIVEAINSLTGKEETA